MMKLNKVLYNLFLKSGGISIDSRSIVANELFFSINGERLNGNKYAEIAIDKGALAVIVDDPKYYIEDNPKFILVENSVLELQKLASDYRDNFEIPVIGITGSNGKTTTKELIYSVLSTSYKVHATTGNFNNHIGVPLTLLSTPQDTEILIVEMGANAAGEIQELCDICKPTEGVITNISEAHLEGFGDFVTIIDTKTALYRTLIENNGIIYVNQEDSLLLDSLKDYKNMIRYYPDNLLSLKIADPNVSWDYTINETVGVLDTNLVGMYNKPNIAVAIALGLNHGIELEDILFGISNYIPSNNRSQLFTVGNNRYILDAYNANPASMYKSIENMDSIVAENKVLILGDMLELGSIEMEAHQKMVDFITDYQWNKVFLVGPRFMKTKVEEEMFSKYATILDLKDHLESYSLNNALVLLKGSRGIALEKLFDK